MTKLTPINWILIILGALIVILLSVDIFTRVRPVNSDHDKEISRLNHKLDSLIAANTVLLSQYRRDTAAIRSSSQVFTARIKPLQKQAYQSTTNPIVIAVRDSLPAVEAAFRSLEAVIEAQGDRIQEQGSQIASIQRAHEDIVNNLRDQITAMNSKYAEEAEKNVELQRHLRKLKRRVFIRTTLIPIAAGIAVVLLI